VWVPPCGGEFRGHPVEASRQAKIDSHADDCAFEMSRRVGGGMGGP
jgi:hypothetical protein